MKDSASRKIQFVILSLLFVSGYFLLFLNTHLYSQMATGDHGRDLYVFWRTGLYAEQPYKDYWWIYGPFMPYFYGLFFKYMGVNIATAIFTQKLILFGAGVFIYLLFNLFSFGIIGVLCAIWFWICFPGFGYTFNHIGGIFLMVVQMYFLAKYLVSNKNSSLYFALSSAFLCAFVKINFGLIAIGIVFITQILVFFNSSKQIQKQDAFFGLMCLLVAPISVLLIYWLLTRGMTLTELRQCFPYLAKDHPYSIPPTEAIWVFILYFYDSLIENFHIAGIIILSGISLLYFAAVKFKKNSFCHNSNIVIKFIIILSFWGVLNLHEFAVSGVYFRLFWSWPMLYIVLFMIIGIALDNSRKLTKGLGYSIISGLIMLCILSDGNQFLEQYDQKNFIAGSQGQVYVSNNEEWVFTVNDTVEYLDKILNPDETFFAAPYDLMYYYLTQRKIPSRQMIFFDYIGTTENQENKLIEEIEEKHIKYVLLSSRIISYEQGLGLFGKTNSHILNTYINDNFEEIKRFGNWNKAGGWSQNHGTKILRRKES